MAKKKSATKSSASWRNHLDQPVHGLIGYGVLLVLAVVVLIFVYSLQWYIIP